MSFTLTLTTNIGISETLRRSSESKSFAAWSCTAREEAIVSMPYNTTTNLPTYTNYIFQADELATNIVVGWVHNSNTVELPINQITIVAPPATPYLRNTSTDSTTNPVPVKVVAYT